jgi:excisionase family DNA binding protein
MAIMETKNQYLTIPQITETLNMGSRAVMNLIRRGELPAHKFGAEIRVRVDDFSSFLEKSKVRSEGACRAI